MSDISLGVERITSINEAIRNQTRRDTHRSLEPIKEIIDECLVIVRSRTSGINVDVECDELVKYEVVRSQFGQVIMNLLANAADAINECSDSQDTDGRILICAWNCEKNGLYVRIEDTGPGVPLDIREKILEPFFTTKAVGDGTGLGMSIVLRILEQIGLQLVIDDSETLGGASMMICPRVEEQAEG